jgi:hypothetical protein
MVATVALLPARDVGHQQQRWCVAHATATVRVVAAEGGTRAAMTVLGGVAAVALVAAVLANAMRHAETARRLIVIGAQVQPDGRGRAQTVVQQQGPCACRKTTVIGHSLQCPTKAYIRVSMQTPATVLAATWRKHRPVRNQLRNIGAKGKANSSAPWAR